MDRSAVQRWVGGYERVWRTAGTERLGELFSSGVSYLPSPWARAVEGLDELARLWDAEREGPDEEFTFRSDVVAVDGDTAVVRVLVDYGGASSSRWRDLWVLRFTADGRCEAFEEWPFTPGQHDGREPREEVRSRVGGDRRPEGLKGG
ncbi:MAG: nuclear transport factor 2 family protein [Egibacteraceae bacterium]